MISQRLEFVVLASLFIDFAQAGDIDWLIHLDERQNDVSVQWKSEVFFDVEWKPHHVGHFGRLVNSFSFDWAICSLLEFESSNFYGQNSDL